jgi:small-conductance mechanosensitive channel
VPATLSMLINYSIVTLGFLSAMAAVGIEVSQFAIIFGALGVGIGFGLQNIVNNFISGLILVFERPVKIGDTIEVGTMIGEVRRIGIRSSTVRTYDGAEVIVPNGNLISAEVINWTLSDRIRRIKIPVGVAYGTDPQKVLDLLAGVAKDSKDVLSFPEPHALFLGFGASSLDFELRFWTANFEHWMRVASQITVGVNTALAEAGIQIPFPQRDLHLRSLEPAVEQALSGTKRQEAPP